MTKQPEKRPKFLQLLKAHLSSKGGSFVSKFREKEGRRASWEITEMGPVRFETEPNRPKPVRFELF
jgi:hypothetical protein